MNLATHNTKRNQVTLRRIDRFKLRLLKFHDYVGELLVSIDELEQQYKNKACNKAQVEALRKVIRDAKC